MSALPDAINMGSDQSSMNMNGTEMAGMDKTAQPGGGTATSVTRLVEAPSQAPVKTFNLTAQEARLDLGEGKLVEAWTFNGTAPGPELRVQQGDLVVVHLKNNLPFSTTIHWHGVAVPNAEDGVAGVTQDAIKPGESYTYSFIAREAGTYWYHAHQQSFLQVSHGMYGTLVVEPKNSAAYDDRDYTLVLKEWADEASCFKDCSETLTINGQRQGLHLVAQPGEMVRLRLVNAGEDTHLPVVVGTAVEVVALDGHDLNAPTPLENTRFPIAPAQRYDLRFRMPASGTVTLLDANPGSLPANQHPAVIIGSTPSTAPSASVSQSYPDNAPQFDLTHYGSPQMPFSKESGASFDAQYNLVLGNHLGFYDRHITMLFTINDQVFPNIPMITVQPGQAVKLHITNPSDIPHAMHLHGHTFNVLSRNDKPLSGSPVRLDTLLVNPGESYEIVFVANNPGLWMLHCHMLRHAAQGMDMMVVYPNISTPFTVGDKSGNHPD
ncbi:MAG TPA: multicopper oxidase family protein [Chloroflexia bacterium]|nr:multicopper oxidase family protein [Chloroflexia bacterium]